MLIAAPAYLCQQRNSVEYIASSLSATVCLKINHATYVVSPENKKEEKREWFYSPVHRRRPTSKTLGWVNVPSQSLVCLVTRPERPPCCKLRSGLGELEGLHCVQSTRLDSTRLDLPRSIARRAAYLPHGSDCGRRGLNVPSSGLAQWLIG